MEEKIAFIAHKNSMTCVTGIIFLTRLDFPVDVVECRHAGTNKIGPVSAVGIGRIIEIE